MRLQSLFINDFGIFYNQKMEGISAGLVVIGGLNRAGKSTLLQILRYLPYGIPRKKGLPPCRENYDLVGLFELDNGKRAQIHLSGYSKPVVSFLGDNQEGSFSHLIYNGLDFFSYSQLFTISLDELQRLPIGSSNREERKIYSILLGAGFSDFMHLPQMEEYFNKEAERIGGKRGQPDVWEFKPHYQLIKQGLKLRDEALRQVAEFHQRKEELEQTIQKKSRLEGDLQTLMEEIIRLDSLKSIYDEYLKLVGLEAQIKEQQVKVFPITKLETAKSFATDYQVCLTDYQEVLSRFESEANCAWNMVGEIILKFSEEIKFYYNELAGYREKIANLQKIGKRLEEEEAEILLKLKDINSEWSCFEELLAIRTDKIERSIFFRLLDDYQVKKLELKQTLNQLQELRDTRRILINKIKEVNNSKPGLFPELKWYYLLSLVCVIAGILLYFINPYLLLISLSGIPGFGFYLFYKYSSAAGKVQYLENLKNQKVEIDLRLDAVQKRIKEIELELKPYEEKILKYREILGCNINSSLDMLRERFRDVVELQQQIKKWLREHQEYLKLKGQVNRQMKELAFFLKKFPGFSEVDLSADCFFAEYKVLFRNIEHLNQILNIAQELALVRNRKKNLEAKIEDLITARNEKENKESGDYLERLHEFIRCGEEFLEYSRLKEEAKLLQARIIQAFKSDRVRQSLVSRHSSPIKDDQQLYKVISDFCQQFSSAEEVAQVLKKTMENYQNKESDLKDLIEKQQILEKELAELATPEKMEEAQRLIAEGRERLATLAERYAVYKAAAFLLKKVQEDFVEQSRDKMLAKASRYFQKITRGEYQKILPPEKTAGDFKVIRNNQLEDAETLSRGTIEQLFLTLRIGRIKEITPSLPVIIDDGLVNFDRFHLEEALKVILELSSTHQVFILTCHPYLIDYINRSSKNAQYWKLENGAFTRSDPEKLWEHLTGIKNTDGN